MSVPLNAGRHAAPVERLLALRQHHMDGRRSPHKPLLVLLALGRLAATGSSAVPWSVAEQRLADLVAEFGPPSRTGRAQSAAYPFTRLRADGVWRLDRDVPMDLVGPLHAQVPTGRLEPTLEAILAEEPALLRSVARQIVDAQFPRTVAEDVLVAVGLDPDDVLVVGGAPAEEVTRRRDPAWRERVIEAWDRQCAFCGYDGHLGTATAGIEAAHVRWFAFEGPDTLDNGLALCSLDHKLFDLGVLGLTEDYAVDVTASYTARTGAGRRVYDLHGLALRPRPGTTMPAAPHVRWHREQVFKGLALTR